MKDIDDAEKITKANDLLQKSIDNAGGWRALEEAMQTSGEKSASLFRNNLVNAVLNGKDEKQITEAISFYRIIAAVRRDGESPVDVARNLGFGVGRNKYSSKKHLEEGWEFDSEKLQAKIDGLRGEHGNNHDFDTFDEYMDILRELREPKQLNLPFAV